MEFHSGAILETHELVSYQSLGATRSWSLTYDSVRADPRPILHFGFDNTPADPASRLVAKLSFSRDGFTQQLPGFASGQFGLTGGEHFWSLPGGNIDGALQGDLRGQPSGSYDYTLSTGLLRLRDQLFTGSLADQRGQLIHVNSIGSPFGNGWGLAGLQELVENPDGSVLLIDGDGSELIFERPAAAGGAYVSPPGDFSAVERLAGGIFRRTMTDQTVYTFDTQNRLERMRDRNGNETRYAYEAAGALTKVIDPVGLETNFSSTQGKITAITDPAGRVTRLDYDSAGNLMRVTDPDGSQRTWGYDGDRHITSEIDQRGQREETSYHFSGRSIGGVRKDGSLLHFAPVQIQGLLSPEATINPLQAPAALRRGAAEATYMDGNGNVLRKSLDQAGQEVASLDGVGPLPTVQRNADNLVTQVRDGRGQKTEFTYDARGNLLTVRDSLSRGGGFIDISQTGDPVPGLKNNDDRSVLVTLPFPFTFYGTSYTQAGISSNGVVSFGGTNSEYSNVALSAGASSLSNRPSLLPFWDDLETRTDEGVVADVFFETLGPAGSREFVIQWHQVERYPFASRTGDVTFQVVLTEGTNAIQFNYADVHFAGATETSFGAGRSATIGIWNSNTQFQQFSFNSASLRDGLTLNVTEGGITEAGGTGPGEKRFTYDAVFSQLTSATDELSRQSLFAVDPATGNVLSTTRVVGAVGGADDVVTRMTYTLQGLLATLTDPNGHMTRYDYDQLGRLITISEAFGTPDQGLTRFEYDAAGNISASIDENGNRTAHQYDALNRPILITEADPDGVGPLTAPVTQQVYDSAGNLIRFIDARNRTSQFAYDPLNRLTSTTDAIGGGSRLSYDLAGNVASSIDELGRATRYRYDSRNRLVETIDAAGGRAFVKYDADDNPVVTTDENGHATRYAYDARSRLVRVTDALGKATVIDYNAADDLIAVSDRNGRKTQYAYDDLARRITVADARGGVLTYAYDPVGNIVAQTDELNRRTQTSYDARDRSTSNTSPLGNTVSFVYDAASNLTAVRDGLNQATQYAYDALNRRVRRTDALNGVMSYVYDTMDNVVAMTDELGRTWQYAYDDLDRQTSMTDPLGHVSRMAYDALGNLLSSTDGVGQVTRYDYDVLNRQTKITDARGGVTRFTYDAVGKLLSLTDPVNNTTRYAYDGLDRQVRETNPLGADRIFAYDAVGNLNSLTDRNGRVRRFTYDELDRRTSEQWLDATANPIRTFNYTFDAASQLTAAADPDSTYAYTYDLDGRQTSVSNAGTPGVPSVALGYTYDAANNVRTRTDTISGTLRGTNSYTNDQLNRMVRITQSGTGVTDKRVDMSYDADSQMTGVARFADLAGTQSVASSAYSYDNAGRLTGLTHARSATTLAAYAWTYDAADRITQATSLDGTSNYNYDTTNQLAGADHSFQTDESYSYDLNGNRTNPGYENDPNNRLKSDGLFNYVYDAEGNRINRTDIATGEVTTYEWGFRNRLTLVTTKNASGTILMQASYSYDVFDRRIAKIVDADGAGPKAAQTTRFVYDGVHIALTFDGAGTQTHRYLHGPVVDQIMADENVLGLILWPLTDNLGTVRDLADSTGAIQNHISYDSFGQITAETNTAIDHLFDYTGRELDRETGLYFYRARYYDGLVGRFVSEDPIGFASGDLNKYRFVSNDPVSFTDPFGLDPSPKPATVACPPSKPTTAVDNKYDFCFTVPVAVAAIADNVPRPVDLPHDASTLEGQARSTGRTVEISARADQSGANVQQGDILLLNGSHCGYVDKNAAGELVVIHGLQSRQGDRQGDAGAINRQEFERQFRQPSPISIRDIRDSNVTSPTTGFTVYVEPAATILQFYGGKPIKIFRRP